MKTIKKTTVFIMTLILSLLVIPIAGQEVYAAGGNISSLPVSIKAYPVSTANNTPAFANKGDGNKSGTIYAADLCTITRIDGDGWLIVNYPTSNNRTRTLFVRARDFFCATSFQEASVSKYATAYRRSSGNESIGSVDAADRLVYVIGSSQNGRTQIVYRVTNSNYYKMGWVSTDALSKTPSSQPSLTFSPSSVTLTEGTNGTVNVKFSGDGLKTLNVESSNTSVCTAYWSGTTDWKAGTSTLTVKGKKAGSANITVSFLNNSGTKFYSKSFSVSVKNNATPATYYVKTNGANLTVRSGPSTGYTSLGKLSNGTAVSVYSISNGWAKIKFGSGTGYVSAAYLSKTKPDNNNTTSYCKPVSVNSAYFRSKSDDNGWFGYHDVNGVSIGTSVYAIADGTAQFRQSYRTDSSGKYLTSYGNSIKFTSSDGKTTAIYAHLNSFNGVSQEIPSTRTKAESGGTVMVIASRRVSAGDLIGYVGTTGNSTGAHLHFELRINGTRVDPTEYVDIPGK